MFDTIQLAVGAFEPAITVHRNHDQGTAWAVYEFYPFSNDGVLYNVALEEDVRASLKGLVLDVALEDYTAEEWPVVEVAVRVRDIDPTMDDEE
ncbi:hypothetical protein ACXIUA_00335, partial [Corynebacterium sp. UMB8791]